MALAKPVNGEDIRALVAALPGPDTASARAVERRDAMLTKPAGALGRLEEIAVWLAAWQRRHPPAVERVKVLVFAGNHGVAARGVSAYPAAVTAQMVANFDAGGAAVNQLVGAVGAELAVHALSLERPTADITTAPAMSDTECAAAVAFGMEQVEADIDLLCVGEMGIGNTTVASALCHALHGGAAADWVGSGSGIDDAGLERKLGAVEAAIATHRTTLSDPVAVLARLGGRELAAIAGAVIAARLEGVPVLLDGFVATAAVAPLAALNPSALDHCLAAHRSAEAAHGRLLDALGKQPLLDLGMRLGEASGAALAASIVKAAAAVHGGMATFGQAGVSERSR